MGQPDADAKVLEFIPWRSVILIERHTSDMQIFSDLDSLSKAGADLFVKLSEQSIAERGVFHVALSGGSTPKRMFELLATDAYREIIDWSKVHAFWGDERFVSPTDEQSNEHMARKALLDQVPIPAQNIHGMFQQGDVESAAQAYEVLIRKELGDKLALDLTMLGIGPDGHTASLFPGEPAVHETERLVVAGLGHAGVAQRITMTPPLINRSHCVLFLVAGADKVAPMKRVLEGPENWEETPSQAVARHAPNVIWLVDQSALPE
jgi:6-phosphogluconolactonase